MEALGDRGGAVDAHAQRRADGDPEHRVGEAALEALRSQQGHDRHQGGAEEHAEDHPLLVGLEPVDGREGGLEDHRLLVLNRDHRLEAQSVQPGIAAHHRLLVQGRDAGPRPEAAGEQHDEQTDENQTLVFQHFSLERAVAPKKARARRHTS